MLAIPDTSNEIYFGMIEAVLFLRFRTKHCQNFIRRMSKRRFRIGLAQLRKETLRLLPQLRLILRNRLAPHKGISVCVGFDLRTVHEHMDDVSSSTTSYTNSCAERMLIRSGFSGHPVIFIATCFPIKQSRAACISLRCHELAFRTPVIHVSIWGGFRFVLFVLRNDLDFRRAAYHKARLRLDQLFNLIGNDNGRPVLKVFGIFPCLPGSIVSKKNSPPSCLLAKGPQNKVWY